MSTTAFDTLRYTKKLTEVGVPIRQAEVQAETIAEIIEEKLTSKIDLKILKKDFDLRMSELKNELIKWVLGAGLAQTAIVVSCIKLIH